MKPLFLSLLTLLTVSIISAQANPPAENEDALAPTVLELILAREDADGNIEEDIEIFAPRDIPIYCYVDLSTTKPLLVKLVFVAVKVAGVRPNKRVVTASYKTKDDENFVTFTGRPEKTWHLGRYRVEIFIDGTLAKTKEFTVEKP